LDSVYIRHGGLVNCLIRMGLPGMIDIVSMQIADQNNMYSLASLEWFVQDIEWISQISSQNNPLRQYKLVRIWYISSQGCLHHFQMR
jgi:hypothetical protein